MKSSAVRVIREEIQAIDRDWWKGALGFDAADDDRPSTLSGRTRLFYNKTVIPDAEEIGRAHV